MGFLVFLVWIGWGSGKTILKHGCTLPWAISRSISLQLVFLNECTELLWLNCLGFQLGIKATRLEASHYLHSQLSFHRMGWTDLKSPLLTERSCFLFGVPCCLLQHVCYSCWAFGNKIILLQQQKANRIFLLFVRLLVCLGFVLLWEGSRTEQQIHQPFQWWEAINEGSCLWGGMNPWSPAEHSCCWVCLKGRCWLGALRPTTHNPSQREKREFLSCGYTDDISQGYIRKPCLCDWVLCQSSLKALFKLVKWNKTLRLYWSKKKSWHLRPLSFWPQACLAPATTQHDLKAQVFK